MLMSFTEKNFQSLFTKWLREERKQGRHKTSAAFELKCKKKGARLNFKSDFEPQQLPKLLQAREECVYKKLSDADPSLKPFDALQICHSDAFVVIMWYEPRKPKQMVWIDIKTLLLWTKVHSKKSITELEAKEIGKVYNL